MDFNATHNDMAEMEYQVELSGSGSEKEITCQDSFDMTEGCPRNLCECDKKFAQNIAKLDDECQSTGNNCAANKFYTETATQSQGKIEMEGHRMRNEPTCFPKIEKPKSLCQKNLDRFSLGNPKIRKPKN